MFGWISKIFNKDKKAPEKFKIDKVEEFKKDFWEEKYIFPPESKYSSFGSSEGYYAREKTEDELYGDIDLE